MSLIRGKAIYLSLWMPSVFTFFWYLSFQTRPPSIPEKVLAKKEFVVRIAAQTDQGFHFVATGFVLMCARRCFVLTNQHSIEKAKQQYGKNVSVWVDFKPPVNAHRAEVLKEDVAADYAILATAVQSNTEIKSELADAEVGATLFILGHDDTHPDKESLQISQARVEFAAPWAGKPFGFIVSGVYPGDTVQAYLVSGTDCKEGGSGSLVVDKDGRTVGYVKGRTDDGKCFVISGRRAWEAIQELKP